MNLMLSEEHQKYIFEKYPRLSVLHCCIREFREMFEKRRLPLLYLFVDKYKKCDIKVLQMVWNETLMLSKMLLHVIIVTDLLRARIADSK